MKEFVQKHAKKAVSFAQRVAEKVTGDMAAQRVLRVMGAITAIGILATAEAQAGTTGAELQAAWEFVEDLIGGFGGRMIAAIGIVYSLFLGFAQQDFKKMAVGLGMSGGVAFTPQIATGLVGALI